MELKTVLLNPYRKKNKHAAKAPHANPIIRPSANSFFFIFH